MKMKLLRSQSAPGAPVVEERQPVAVAAGEEDEESLAQTRANATDARVFLIPVDESIRGRSGHTWSYPLRDYERGCFVGHLPGALNLLQARDWLRIILDGEDIRQWERPRGTMGLQSSRHTKWLVADGCSCTYRYCGTPVAPATFPSWMEDLLGLVMPLCGLRDRDDWPNCCNVNLYTQGSQSIDWHGDDERLFLGRQQNTRVVSLSLGAARAFELRPRRESQAVSTSTRAGEANEETEKTEDEEEPFVHRLDLRNGDLCTMEGMTQCHYVQRVPRASIKPVAVRLNLTWRWIVAHEQHCGGS